MNSKWKVISSIMLLIALICAVFTGLLIQNCKTTLHRYVTEEIKSVRAITEVIENQHKIQYKNRIKSLINPDTSASHHNMLQAFAARDRDNLLRLSLPFFNTLKKENKHFSTFSWILPDNHAFLRVHKPEKFGDDISTMRPDVVAANYNMQQYAGYTVGFQGMQYRIISPVSYQGQHIGAVQFGLRSSALLDVIQKRLQIPVGLVMENSHYQYIKQSTLPTFTGKTHTIQARDIDLFSKSGDAGNWSTAQQEVQIHGKEYIIVTVLDLNNYNEELQGRIIAALDISTELARKNRLLMMAAALTTIILLLSFLILNGSYQRLTLEINTLNCSLQENNKELENRVNERTLALEQEMTERKNAEEKAQRSSKMEAIGLMAGGVAHDLNNILSGIVSYPELLLLQMPEGNPQRKLVEAIQDSGKRAAAVVSDLLTVARGVASDKHIVNMNDLVKEYLDSPEFQQTQLHHPLIRCLQNYDPNLLNISCSPVHIKKSLMNLLNNGLEAMDDLGEISVSTHNEYVDVPFSGDTYMEKGEYVVVSVSDSGQGINKEDLEHIFEPFYTKKKMGRSGTGLGLAIVWNTMQDHGGTVTIDSSSEGTRFDLYFPGIREDVSTLQDKQEIAELRGNGEHILVVDDEAQQRDIAVQMLSVLGYNATSVRSGEEAVSHIRENRVDLLLLDMIMDKGINGRETYEQIVAISPGQKAIIASGFSETEDVKKTQEKGADLFMRKPYTLSLLGSAVKQVLERQTIPPGDLP